MTKSPQELNSETQILNIIAKAIDDDDLATVKKLVNYHNVNSNFSQVSCDYFDYDSISNIPIILHAIFSRKFEIANYLLSLNPNMENCTAEKILGTSENERENIFREIYISETDADQIVEYIFSKIDIPQVREFLIREGNGTLLSILLSKENYELANKMLDLKNEDGTQAIDINNFDATSSSCGYIEYMCSPAIFFAINNEEILQKIIDLYSTKLDLNCEIAFEEPEEGSGTYLWAYANFVNII